MYHYSITITLWRNYIYLKCKYYDEYVASVPLFSNNNSSLSELRISEMQKLKFELKFRYYDESVAYVTWLYNNDWSLT